MFPLKPLPCITLPLWAKIITMLLIRLYLIYRNSLLFNTYSFAYTECISIEKRLRESLIGKIGATQNFLKHNFHEKIFSYHFKQYKFFLNLCKVIRLYLFQIHCILWCKVVYHMCLFVSALKMDSLHDHQLIKNRKVCLKK